MLLAFCSSGVCDPAACLKEMASELVALANRRGGPDNITVIILQIGEPSPLAHVLEQ
jgi:serine/threonine protein phosphatase PrpC